MAQIIFVVLMNLSAWAHSGSECSTSYTAFEINLTSLGTSISNLSYVAPPKTCYELGNITLKLQYLSVESKLIQSFPFSSDLNDVSNGIIAHSKAFCARETYSEKDSFQLEQALAHYLGKIEKLQKRIAKMQFSLIQKKPEIIERELKAQYANYLSRLHQQLKHLAEHTEALNYSKLPSICYQSAPVINEFSSFQAHIGRIFADFPWPSSSADDYFESYAFIFPLCSAEGRALKPEGYENAHFFFKERSENFKEESEKYLRGRIYQ